MLAGEHPRVWLPIIIVRPEMVEGGFLSPFRAQVDLLIPGPRALPWASKRRRFQRRNLWCGILILLQQDIDGAHDFDRLPVLRSHDLARETALAIDQICFGKHGGAVI